MGLATNLLLAFLPLAIANQVIYLPQAYHYVPVVPLVQLPFVQTLGVHGNRKHELTPAASYHGNCPDDVTANWQETETGVKANVRVKRPAARPLTYVHGSGGWEVELVWDRPIASLEVSNAGVTAASDTHAYFRIGPDSSLARSQPTEEQNEVDFSFTAEFMPDQPRAGLRAVVVNGVYQTCRPGPTSSNVVETKGVRLAKPVSWPKKVLGLYVLLADDDEDGYESSAEWQPELFPWQQEGSNVLFFTFIHPDTMEVPPSFRKLAASRGTDQPGAVPKDTVIMFAIGGYAYSIKPNPWSWLTSKEAAEKMAEKVARWPEEYGCDGIDLDLEEGAGARKEAGPNMIHFIRRLKELSPNIIVSQPTYGYPQVQAETDVINASWDTEGKHQGLADSIGLMVYEDTQALQYVKNFANGAGQWQGFPIKVNAPKNVILLGAKGSSSSSTIVKLARAAVEDDLLGIMVWYASVKNGFDYAPFWDASTKNDSIEGYKEAMKMFNKAMATSKVIEDASDVIKDTADVTVVTKDVDADVVVVGEED